MDKSTCPFGPCGDCPNNDICKKPEYIEFKRAGEIETIQEPCSDPCHVYAAVKDYHGTPYKAYLMASFKNFHLAIVFVADLMDNHMDLDYITIVDEGEG